MAEDTVEGMVEAMEDVVMVDMGEEVMVEDQEAVMAEDSTRSECQEAGAKVKLPAPALVSEVDTVGLVDPSPPARLVPAPVRVHSAAVDTGKLK